MEVTEKHIYETTFKDDGQIELKDYTCLYDPNNELISKTLLASTVNPDSKDYTSKMSVVLDRINKKIPENKNFSIIETEEV